MPNPQFAVKVVTDSTTPSTPQSFFQWYCHLEALKAGVNVTDYRAKFTLKNPLPNPINPGDNIGQLEIRKVSGPDVYAFHIDIPQNVKLNQGERYAVTVKHLYLPGNPEQDPPVNVDEPRQP